MSTPCAPPERIRLPWRQRVLPLIAVAVAAPLTILPPKNLRWVLEFARRGARPAPADQTSRARQAIMAVSLRCAVNGCLQRSIATALLCRVRGVWPTWRLGVCTAPFGAHAWVEAEGRMIDEPMPAGHYTPMLTVAPAQVAADPDHYSEMGTGTGDFRLHRQVLSVGTSDGAVLLHLRTGHYWQLNPVGLDSLRHLLSGRSVEDIATDFAAEYAIDPAGPRRDITVMTDQLREAGFLVGP
ncbi:lasso peptide biosynthesis PqqD family chaperone [Nocardia panacis]|uniref:Lasso peptide biosynthesis PqqD family chaperone n=1 Tax=Nocardia panacis TaxID=2340916 RepID=A0A3A4K5C2_9NOCA|nr:lasso peptide biosynthesis PqqD family chaperone [Nocardia panacis]RJO73691.1 lasso peptide biosynthesis PqqD family chaperone [Nocardia panacis]